MEKNVPRLVHALLVAAISANLAFAPLASARAKEPTPIKVLGKGIESKKTHERLQLACVGKPIAKGSLELGCEKLQFVIAYLSGAVDRVGPVFQLKDGAGRFKKQFKKQLLKAGVTKKVTDAEASPLSRAIQQDKTWAMLLVIASSGAVLFATGSGGWALLGLVAPQFLEAIFRPVTKMLIAKSGGALAHASNVKTLNDRSQDGWQLKPKRVKHKHFLRAIKALNGGVAPAEKAFCGMTYSYARTGVHFDAERTREECRALCRDYAKLTLAGDQTASCEWGRKKNGEGIPLETIVVETPEAAKAAAEAEEEEERPSATDAEDERLIETLSAAAAEETLRALPDDDRTTEE